GAGRQLLHQSRLAPARLAAQQHQRRGGGQRPARLGLALHQRGRALHGEGRARGGPGGGLGAGEGRGAADGGGQLAGGRQRLQVELVGQALGEAAVRRQGQVALARQVGVAHVGLERLLGQLV